MKKEGKLERIVLSHRKIMELERKGELLPPFQKREEPKKTAPKLPPRAILARTLHKAIRQFEAEGCPEAFDLSIHIDQMLKRLEEEGFISKRDKSGRFTYQKPGR